MERNTKASQQRTNPKLLLSGPVSVPADANLVELGSVYVLCDRRTSFFSLTSSCKLYFSILGDFVITTVNHENEEPTKVDGFQVQYCAKNKYTTYT